MELESGVKAIVLDLDGTLLNSQKKVSERICSSVFIFTIQ
nr:HAD hydrolase family protein [Bacillus nitratireducens]